jgi:thiol-disulfide isomerase/thioredoxin
MFKVLIHISFYILVFGRSLFSQQTGAMFFLNGKINGVNERMIYLSYYDDILQTGRLDSSLVKRDSFSFSGNINQPAVAFIKLNKKEAVGLNATNIFIEPGNMKLILKLNDFGNAHLIGSHTQKDYEDLKLKENRVVKNHPALFDSNGYVIENLDKYQQVRLSVVFDSLNKIHYEYFDQHPTSYLTAYLLQSHTRNLTPDSLAIFYNRLNEHLKQHPVTQTIRTRLKNTKAGSIGSIAPNFIAKDTSGNDFYFGLLKGEYILLDFWASWCVPCRQNNPFLIELYNKYKTRGLRIVGITDDRDISKWRDAILNDKTSIWTHVRRETNAGLKLKGLPDKNDINEKFNISTLPTYLLIDKYGVIIGRFESNDDFFNKLTLKLSSLFVGKNEQ